MYPYTYRERGRYEYDGAVVGAKTKRKNLAHAYIIRK